MATVAWTGGLFDPTASRWDFGREPERLAAALGALLGRGIGRIDGVVCSASGSRHGDRYEARVLRTLWPGAMPPLLTPKAVLGEHGGSTLAAAIAILHGHCVGAPVDGFESDPDLDVRPHYGPLEQPPARLLVTAFATGGACAFAVLDRMPDNR